MEVEKKNFSNGQRPQGEAMARAIGRALTKSGVGIPFYGDFYADLNGEEWRAYELGSARLRLSKQLGTQTRLLFPCNSLGEVGCASGAVAICCAMRSLERGYSHGGVVLVTSSSDHGDVGAICVGKSL